MTMTLRPGQVVRPVPGSLTATRRAVPNRVANRVAKPVRGVVIRGTAQRVFADDAVIWQAPGHYTVTNCHDEWEVIPDTQHTVEERVRAAEAGYEFPAWWDPEDGEIPETETLAWALMVALLPPDVVEGLFPEDGDWPTSFVDLAIVAAQIMDEATPDVAYLTGDRSA